VYQQCCRIAILQLVLLAGWLVCCGAIKIIGTAVQMKMVDGADAFVLHGDCGVQVLSHATHASIYC
jgi:hypothetical protein